MEQPSRGLKILRHIHLFVILWVLFGWIVPFKVMLIAHIVALPLFIVHWKTNDGKCILTDLETRWFQVPASKERAVFSRRLIRVFFNREATETQGMFLIYFLMTSAACFSGLHLWLL